MPTQQHIARSEVLTQAALEARLAEARAALGKARVALGRAQADEGALVASGKKIQAEFQAMDEEDQRVLVHKLRERDACVLIQAHTRGYFTRKFLEKTLLVLQQATQRRHQVRRKARLVSQLHELRRLVHEMVYGQPGLPDASAVRIQRVNIVQFWILIKDCLCTLLLLKSLNFSRKIKLKPFIKIFKNPDSELAGSPRAKESHLGAANALHLRLAAPNAHCADSARVRMARQSGAHARSQDARCAASPQGAGASTGAGRGGRRRHPARGAWLSREAQAARAPAPAWPGY